MTIADHNTIYFDKIERTNKLQTLVAIANAAVNIKEKDKVIKTLEYALDIFKEPKKDKLGSGTYEGKANQWNSKYTLSRDFGLVEESREKIILHEFGMRLAKGEISAKYFMSVVMLNYIQIINDKVVNPLYSIIISMKVSGQNKITKKELKYIKEFNLNGEDKEGFINGLFDILKDTYFFKKISNDTLELDEKLFTCETLLSVINTECLNQNVSEIKDKYGLNGQKNWCEYLSKENDSFKLMLVLGGVDKAKNIKINSSLINKPYNRIIFGAPGTGKSYFLEKEREVLGNNYERVTFHSNYSYGQFVGAYKPTPDIGTDGSDIITYKYVPGPFMRVLVKSLKDNMSPQLLIIEEINRANVAAVFGDIFQLLDRNYDGESEYEIETSEEMKKYLHKELKGDISQYEKIKIPSNMYIWATMNSADQGVFPMDTAFKRRWEFEYMSVNKNEQGVEGIHVLLGDDKHKVEWNRLRRAINKILQKKCKANEDKLLGPYFISKSILESNENGCVKDNDKFIKIFKGKVLMYLYEDAVGRQHRSKVFENCDESATYSMVCSRFDEIGEKIFGDNLNLEEDGENIEE